MSKWPGKDPKKDYSIIRHYNSEMAVKLGHMFTSAGIFFDTTAYVESLIPQLQQLELKQRVALMARGIEQYSQESFPATVRKLTSVLPPALPTEKGSFSSHYDLNVIATYVEIFGANHVRESLKFIEQLTQRHTCEFAVRPLLTHHYEETYAQMTEWASHDNFHVRRLAMEGLRPRLPWAPKLDVHIANPDPIFPIATILRNDEYAYVRRSVANNLNDVSRDHPEKILDLTEAWAKDNPSSELEGVIAHSLRTLIKNNNSRALAIANDEAKKP